MPAHKPKNSNLYTWETSISNREASALRGDQISVWGQAEHCSACRSDQILHAKQGKGENNQQIKDEDLLCVGASRPEERGKQPTD